jgi:gluconolactonase
MAKSILTLFLFSFLTLYSQDSLGEIERLDPKLDLLIPKNASLEILASGFSWAEGPVWVPHLNGVIFTDVPQNTAYLWTEKDGLSVFLKPSGMTNHAPHSANQGANGLALNAQGDLILCQHGDRRIARLKKWGFEQAEFETLVDHYKGKWLNSPNDLVFTTNGDLFFTDPPYGLKKQDRDSLKELSFNGIYKWSQTSGLTLLDKTLSRPNGIAFSTDEKTVYVGNSYVTNSIIAAFDLVNGKLTNRQVFFDAKNVTRKGSGLFDGLKVHSSGVVFATGPGGVLVIDSNGKHLGTLRPGKATANCGFDADENYLYLTASDMLMRIKLK